MRKILCSLSGLIMLFTGCKKYPEGGLYSNKRAVFSQNMRGAEFWDIELYEVDGVDSTDLIVSNNDASKRKGYVRFFKYGHDNYCSGTGFTPMKLLLVRIISVFLMAATLGMSLAMESKFAKFLLQMAEA